MTVSISVKSDARAVRAMLGGLPMRPGSRLYRAARAALGRAARTVISRSARTIAKDSGVPAKLVRGRFGRVRQDRYRLRARFRFRDSPVPIALLNPRETRRGVAYRGGTVPGGFLARRRRDGRLALFLRRGRKRLPIAEQVRPLAHPDATIGRVLVTDGAPRFRVEFERAARRALRGGRR